MSTPTPLSTVLKKIRDMQLQPKPRPGERCELCAELIPDEHGHVVDLESRALLCACRPCYLVFAPMGAGGTRFRAVPDRYVSFPEFALTGAQWDAGSESFVDLPHPHRGVLPGHARSRLARAR